MVENFGQCSCVTTMLDMRTSTTINVDIYFKAKGKRSFQTSTAIPLPVEFLRIPRNFRQ